MTNNSTPEEEKTLPDAVPDQEVQGTAPLLRRRRPGRIPMKSHGWGSASQRHISQPEDVHSLSRTMARTCPLLGPKTSSHRPSTPAACSRLRMLGGIIGKGAHWAP